MCSSNKPTNQISVQNGETLPYEIDPNPKQDKQSQFTVLGYVQGLQRSIKENRQNETLKLIRCLRYYVSVDNSPGPRRCLTENQGSLIMLDILKFHLSFSDAIVVQAAWAIGNMLSEPHDVVIYLFQRGVLDLILKLIEERYECCEIVEQAFRSVGNLVIENSEIRNIIFNSKFLEITKEFIVRSKNNTTLLFNNSELEYLMWTLRQIICRMINISQEI